MAFDTWKYTNTYTQWFYRPAASHTCYEVLLPIFLSYNKDKKSLILSIILVTT